ncbi:MAG: MEKHLA domain-containing protein [Cyanobacteria bacterium J06623_7]
MNNHNHQSSTSGDRAIWQQPEVIDWIQIVNQSYWRLFNKNLIEPVGTPAQLSEQLFHAPFVLVSHDTQSDPIFNYANQTALQLWSMSWSEFIQTPSASVTEPDEIADRALMLQQAAEQGYIDNYQGIRTATTGQKFRIERVRLWNLTDSAGQRCGQAATFPSWTWL